MHFVERIGGLRGLLTACVTMTAAMAGGCGSGQTTAMEQYRPKLMFSLPDTCNTPDGMTLDDKTGVVYLSCPNFCDPNYPGIIMKITPDNKISKFADLPLLPETKRVGPMGLDLGPDGNLYVADNQYFNNKNRKSRVLRVKIKDGKADGVEVAADGFSLSNAVIWRGNDMYVTDTFSEVPGEGIIYHITMDEMNKGTVHLTPGEKDPHVLVTQHTLKRGRGDLASCDGITFDGEGNMYCGNFGDGRIFKITFDKAGKATSKLLIDDEKNMPSADGQFWNKADNLIYVADSAANAVRAYTPDGKLKTIWINDDTDGSDGLLDQPCEVLVRGNELIVVCFDMPFPGLKNSKYDKFHTISVIKLK